MVIFFTKLNNYVVNHQKLLNYLRKEQLKVVVENKSIFIILLANKHLAQMSSELSKAQDNSKRFQEMLTVERRKQKALQVNIL